MKDAVKQLHLLFNTIWKEQRLPKDWKKSLIVKLPKKGDLNQCDTDYRGISLLSVPSKILCRVLTDRAKSGVNKMIRQGQQDRDLEGEPLSKHLLFGISGSSSARNGKHHCTLT